MAEWRQLTEQEQKLHPLYGVKNWLAVFGVAVVGRGALTVSEIANAAQARGIELSTLLFQKDPVAEFLRNALLVDGAVVAVILYALFARARSFRLVSSVALVASIPALLAFGFASGNAQIAEAMELSSSRQFCQRPPGAFI